MRTACIIVNYNDAATTIDLLERIRDYKELDYAVVVDNCSTDDSSKHLKERVCSRVIVLDANENKGYGAGNNLGIRYAKDVLNCDVAIVSNPDVSFSDDCLRKIKETFLAHRDVAVVS